MTTELRLRNQAQQIYVRALSSAWRNGVQLHDPSLWLVREPELEEKMLRDADIAHAVQYRRHLIAGQRWTLLPRVERSKTSGLGEVGTAQPITPPNVPGQIMPATAGALSPSPLAVQPMAAPDPGKMAVGIATELMESIRGFTQARLNLARAFFSGARFGYIHGKVKTLTLGDGKPRQWWVPSHIEDRDKRYYRVVPKVNDADGTLSAHWEEWDIVALKFVPVSVERARRTIRHVYQDDQASLGHGHALREALGWWWYAKTHVFEESLTAVERFAQGILAAKIDGIRDAQTGLPNTELIRQWKQVLEDLRARNVLVFDKADDVEFIQMNASGWELLNTIRTELRSTIFTLVLGANLTTGANEGGSYALAQVQENSTEALVQYDREVLEETLTDDLLGCVWYMNHANLNELGIANDMPRFSITQEKREDPKARAEVAQVLNSMGVELSLEDVLEQTGFKRPDVGEDIIKQAPPPASPFGGLPGMPGIPPQGGDDPFASNDSKPQPPKPPQPQQVQG